MQLELQTTVGVVVGNKKAQIKTTWNATQVSLPRDHTRDPPDINEDTSIVDITWFPPEKRGKSSNRGRISLLHQYARKYPQVWLKISQLSP